MRADASLKKDLSQLNQQLQNLQRVSTTPLQSNTLNSRAHMLRNLPQAKNGTTGLSLSLRFWHCRQF